jgi:hypothetical protein
VNYSQSPWYQQFCKTITRCIRPTIGVAMNDEGSTSVMRVAYPNPSNNGFTFRTDAPLESLRVIDQLGRERLIFKQLEAYQTLNFGENLPIGVYFLEMKEANAPLEVVKIVKSI